MLVALRKESVDRNLGDNPKIYVRNGSLSARRAWIEILFIFGSLSLRPSLSARRAWIEISGPLNAACIWVSLSARRAWIEIRQIPRGLRRQWVALRKESVDRNTSCPKVGSIIRASLSARRAWIEISPPLRLLTPAIGRSPQGERG